MINGWKKIGNIISRRNAPLNTAQLQQSAANLQAAALQRSNAGAVSFVFPDGELLLHGAPCPFYFPLEIWANDGDTELRITIDCACLVDDVEIWGAFLTESGVFGEYDKKKVLAGFNGTVELLIPLGAQKGLLRPCICALSENVGSGGAGVVSIPNTALKQVDRRWIVIDFDPNLYALAYQPYLMVWDDSGYLEEALPNDGYVLGYSEVAYPNSGNYYVYLWPSIPRELVTLFQFHASSSNLISNNPDYMGKQSGYFIPVGYLLTRGIFLEISARAPVVEPVRNFRAGLEPSARLFRRLVARAEDILRAPLWASVQPPLDADISGALRPSTPLLPAGLLLPWGKTSSATYQTIYRATLGNNDKIDNSGTEQYKSIYRISGLLGIVGIVDNDTHKIRLKATLSEEDGSASVSVEDTSGLADLQITPLASSGDFAGYSEIGGFMMFSGNAITTAPLEWHSGRGLIPLGDGASNGLAACRLYPFSIDIQEEIDFLGLESIRVLTLEAKAPSTKRGVYFLWIPSIHVLQLSSGVIL